MYKDQHQRLYQYWLIFGFWWCENITILPKNLSEDNLWRATGDENAAICRYHLQFRV